ncbi:putative inactive reductase easA [Lachnellula suecica]|uniref:Putative inactive reductase easA n=1 Tax=Lachnellula suecica TaxID=602035 RepID=A0A8T9CH90_9HELO|nr:putative inactive reductase easA [Lachnellula suecica]
MSQSRLFTPLKIGNIEVQNRISMAPLTRRRATEERIPTPLMKEYYTQRASTPGTLLIAEGTFISSNCGGFPNAPGIWREDQIAAWRTITDAVHAKGSFIFVQIFAVGRAAHAEVAKAEGVPIIAPSAIPIDESSVVPRTMTSEEVKQTVLDFIDAAKNAIRAGFDGVEVHGANGYLLDQFLQDVSNDRHDEYGGSVENRSRLTVEVLKAVVDAIGSERVGLRLSPWGTFQGMRMHDPIPQFTDTITKARTFNLAFLHVRIDGNADYDGYDRIDFLLSLWKGPLLISDEYTPLTAQRLVDEKYPGKDIMVVFGRYFISNPDLVFRIRKDLELNGYKADTFYTNTEVGYTDYPFSKEFLATQ